ncbi:hypothetical protein V3C99_017478 [Haemonchus contortus]|uniref:Reverse transcriptase domain-containing protein n=1 Tax=Haemonchus contortus TaxID=6289 RepID=A0A7I4Z5E3_HAECO
MPLCLTFIDMKTAFDTVETEAVIEALGNQGVPTQYMRMLHDIVLITPNIEQAERMLADFDRPSSRLVFDAPLMLNGTNPLNSPAISVLVEVNIMTDLAPELSRRNCAA